MSDFAIPLALDQPVAPGEPLETLRAAWPAVVSLSFGAFGLVTAEFLPVSLLTPMAAELGVTNGVVGQAITATAVVAAIAGPLLVLSSGRLDRRLIVWALMAMLVASSVMAATASSVAVLLAARAVLGFALGGFWAMMTALALRLVAPRDVPRAMSTIIMGVSVATVVAAPLGAALGELWGWRATFLSAAGLGLVSLGVQMVVLPSLPPTAPPSLASFGTALRRPAVAIGLLTIVIVVSGHFAGFTFIRPFLEEVPQMSVSTISLALLAFGVGGFAGNIAAGAIASRSPAWGVGLASLLIAASALALVLQGPSPAVAFAATAIWGFAFGGFPVSVSIWNARAAPDLAESAGALLSSAFQVAIASGAVIGGLLIDGVGPTGVIVYAAIAVALGAAVILSAGRASERRRAALA
ncbi:MFS transporter [Aureimonas jatrophae]|uniref:MFS transporter, DHA1 family, purine ribonucleoside efflux pump n=1 Tax=Aureimonas jatrophae TaxID=1166073 RepID=A0A1H0HI71_9HYPH|nr:MFS transporter [Aureimonas jatrophae]MBB3950605.1 DHA1 family purine ribonucleoside efflux pump-like MFS transporter [Aureimonas jatrophae]SDO18909.1 MFS transporter, DHA1 family, purine ribonucleoside efflux pump [Aureimonas jatrophae]